jgi:hypothetical protein
MILPSQALVEYVGISGSRLAHLLGRQAERAGQFVGDHKVLVAIAVIAIVLLAFRKRRRA